MGKKRGVPKGSQRIPDEFRRQIGVRIRATMNAYVKAEGKNEHCRITAEDLDVHPRTPYNWYEGICLPTLWNLVRFADYYEVSIDYLLGRTAVKQLAHQLKQVA